MSKLFDPCRECATGVAEGRFNDYCIACFICQEIVRLDIIGRVRALDNEKPENARTRFSAIIDDLAQLNDDTVALDCCGVTLEPGETQCRGCQRQNAFDDATDRAIDDAKEARV